jgi:hypothetical protein
VARAGADILPAMTRALSCLVLFTLACQNQPADAGKPAPAPAKAAPANPHADAPVNPHANPHAPAANPHAAAAPRGPVNPTPVTPSGQVRAEAIAGLSVSVPTEWTRRPGSNPMRLAEFTLPGPGGEVTLIVSRFAGGGGDAQANIDRWKGQFTRPDGSPVDAPRTEVVDRAPLKITTVDLEGTNIAPVTPGAPERHNEPNSRMLGAIVEGSGDPYFFKAVGPAETLAVWAPAFAEAVKSMAVEAK